MLLRRLLCRVTLRGVSASTAELVGRGGWGGLCPEEGGWCFAVACTFWHDLDEGESEHGRYPELMTKSDRS